MEPGTITVGLFGVAGGSSLVHLSGYDNGELTAETRTALHRALDHAIQVAALRLREVAPRAAD